MTKGLFLIHARESLRQDYSGLGYDVSNIDEETLESFCPALPSCLFPIIDKSIGGGRMSKSLFLIHPRQQFKSDLTDLGLNVDGIDEETLETFCPALPSDLLPINEKPVGGGQNMAKSMFLVHPRQSFQEDLQWIDKNVSKIDEENLESFCSAQPPMLTSVENEIQKELIGWLGVIPLKGSQMISDNLAQQREMKQRALEKIFMAVRMALDQAKGEHLVVGLGALTAPLTNQGADILKEFHGQPLSVTTGNAFTAYITIKSIVEIAGKRNCDLSKETIAVLGASGSVGGAVSEHFGINGCNMILCARNESRLKNLKDRIVSGGANPDRITISTDIDDIRKARIVVVTTSSSQVLIKPEHVCPNAIIYDDTQPRNTSEEIGVTRKDVLVVDGGIVETPFIDLGRTSIGLPPKRAYACFSETLILAKAGCRDNFTGNVTLEQMEKVSEIAEKFSNEFYLAPFTSFGKEIDLGINTRKTITSHEYKISEIITNDQLEELKKCIRGTQE